ncbi:hypothetical protein EU545_03665 [Candidatus Thorarchaeota archaeon]|nr:MAG: hypothetical protein EU545_03665 [Candidatus Thorarchaeota archaeon]
MVKGYEVSEDGTLQEVELTKETLDSGSVVCVVDDATKSIYLWKGTGAGIRKKFIGARVATNLRTEYGFHFKVRPLDEGEEPPTFFTALSGETAAEPVIKPGASAPPSPPTTKSETEKPKAPAPSKAPPPKPKSAGVKTTTAPSKPPTPPPTKTSTKAAASRSSPAAAPSQVPSGAIQEMIEELEETDPPEGYRRELLIVYNELFTVAERTIRLFDQVKIERKFEKVKEPPEGTFMAEGFIPRVIVKDGRVLGIELLKGTPDAILSPIKSEMKERLGDLISFFKSEVEQGEAPSAEAKTKKKKKLVAK